MFGYVIDKPRMWGLGAAAAVIGFALFLSVLAVLHHNTRTYPPDTDLAGLHELHQDACEDPVDRGRIVELQNTLSNLGYMLAGMLILLRASSCTALVFAANLIVLSIMSGWYHATLRDTPQDLDVAWVYAALMLLSAYASSVQAQADRPLRVDDRWGWWGWLAIALVAIAAILIGPLVSADETFLSRLLSSLVILAVLAAVSAIFMVGPLARGSRPLDVVYRIFVATLVVAALPLLGYLIKVKSHWDSTSVFCVMVGFLMLQLTFIVLSAGPDDRKGWTLWAPWGELAVTLLVLAGGAFLRLTDGFDSHGGAVTGKLLCKPHGVLQAHALWHLFSAAALLLTYDLLAQFSRGAAIDRPTIFGEGRILRQR